MKFFSKTLIATAIAITLSGCGSSGGGSKPVEAAKPKMTNSQPTETEKTAEERAEEAAAKKAEEEKQAAETQRALAAKKAAEEAKAKAEAENAKAEADKANSTASASTPAPKTENNAAVQPAPQADSKAEDNATAKTEPKADAQPIPVPEPVPAPKTDDATAITPTVPAKVLTKDQAEAEINKGFKAEHKSYDGSLYMETNKIGGISITTDKTGEFQAKSLTASIYDNPSNFNRLVVDGQEITLAKSEGFLETTATSGAKIKSSSVTDSDSNRVRYGLYTADDKTTLFVQGDPKSSLSTKAWEFKGNGLYGKNGKYSEVDSVVTIPKREKLADKADVTVQISPKDKTLEAFSFTGKFDSDNTYKGNSDGITHSGAVYATGSYSNAIVSGAFYRTGGKYDGYNGVYGASSEKK